jgi:hypothetical protein
MSNTSFNFLADSFLFRDFENEFEDYSLTALQDEINSYKKHIESSLDEINIECINKGEEDNFLSEFTKVNDFPSTDRIARAAMYCNKIILDDPIYLTSFKNLEVINRERKLRGMETLSDDMVKKQLARQVQYMKSLTPAVRTTADFVKFYPLSKPFNDKVNLSTVNIPDLTTSFINDETLNWFNTRVQVFEVNEEKKIVDITKICKDIAINFKGDDSRTFFPSYRTLIPTDPDDIYNIQKAIIIDTPPDAEQFKIWIAEEIIKSIKDRFFQLYQKNEYALKFNSMFIANSEFESEFYRTNFSKQIDLDTKSLMVNFQMNFPQVVNESLEDVIKVREWNFESLINYRNNLKSDVVALRNESDARSLSSFSKDLESKYLNELEVLKKLVKSNPAFSKFDLLPITADIITLLTVDSITPGITTGLNLLYKIYNAAFGTQKEIKGNPVYFLHKIGK